MNNTNDKSGWVSVEDRLPKTEGYYRVKFYDGTEDEKPFRIRPSKNINGFMTLKTILYWQPLPQPPQTKNS